MVERLENYHLLSYSQKKHTQKNSPIFCGPHGRDGQKSWSVMYEPSELLAEEWTDRRTDATKNIISLLH